MKPITTTLLTLLLLTQIAPAISAKPKSDWNAVKTLIKNSIAVRTKDGRTYFDLVQSVDDDAIMVQIAGMDDFHAKGSCVSTRRHSKSLAP